MLFYFCACAGSLSYSVLLVRPCLRGRSFIIALPVLGRNAFHLSLFIPPLNRVQPDRTLSPVLVPVPSIPGLSALLGLVSLPNKITPCIFMHFIFALLHSYATLYPYGLDNIQLT